MAGPMGKTLHAPILNRIDIPQDVRRLSTPVTNLARGTAFEARTVGDITEIDIYDGIGFYGVSASMVKEQLAGAGDVRVRINSPGGDVFDGIAIHNDLKDHDGHVTIEVVGLAASAASIIAMAGDTIKIASNAFIMIHFASTIAWGTKELLAEVMEVLGQIDDALVATYVERTGQDADAVRAMLAAETWLGAKAAVEKGFADETTAAAEPQARFDLSGFSNVPAQLRAAETEDQPSTKRDIERVLMQDAGLHRSEARRLLAGGFEALSPMQDAGEDEAAILSAITALADTMKGKDDE